MEDNSEIIDNESALIETESIHINSAECNCPECQKGKRHYIQILDMNRYVNALNDWD